MQDQSIISVEYRELDGFPGYRVGDDGTVWSRRKNGPTNTLNETWKLLKGYKNGDGYISVNLPAIGKSYKQEPRVVHQLVLLAFGFERPSEKHQTRHLNGVRDDNRLSNLAWGTGKENEADKRKHGKSMIGESHWKARLTEQDVHRIRYCYEGVPNIEVALIFGVLHTTISMIRNRKLWKHVP